MMNNFSNIHDRIQYIIDNQYGSNKKKFAESIGYSAQVVSNIVSGRKTNPSYEVLNAIVSTNVYIDAEWLLTGKGSMLKKSTSEKSTESVNLDVYGELINMQKKEITRLENELSVLRTTAKESASSVDLESAAVSKS